MCSLQEAWLDTVSNTVVQNTQQSGAVSASIAELLREDYSLMLFSHLPFLSQFKNDIRWMAKAADVSVERALEYVEILISTEYWVRTPSGNIAVSQNYTRVVNNTGDFLSLAASLQSRLTNDGPCTFQFETIVTKREAVENLNKKLAEAFAEFKAVSARLEGDTMVSYAFSLAYVLDMASKAEVN